MNYIEDNPKLTLLERRARNYAIHHAHFYYGVAKWSDTAVREFLTNEWTRDTPLYWALQQEHDRRNYQFRWGTAHCGGLT